jgi:hypothetical protein
MRSVKNRDSVGELDASVPGFFLHAVKLLAFSVQFLLLLG